MDMTAHSAVVKVDLSMDSTEAEAVYMSILGLMNKTGLGNGELRNSFPTLSDFMDKLYGSGAFIPPVSENASPLAA